MDEHDVKPPVRHNIFDTMSYNSAALAGFAVWKWDAKACRWHKIKDHIERGFDPGVGPTDPGRYDGQIVRWAGVVWNG
jgi:hypothetical protein